MNSRTRALIALVASAAVVVVAGVAWASTSTGIGTSLAQVTDDVAADDLGQTGALDADAAPAPERRSAPQPDASDGPAASETLDVPEVAVVDATEIVIPQDVAPPTSLTLGSLDVTMPVVATGVAEDGQMELPDDPSVLGWYRFGAVPGDTEGSAVLAGHVDSVEYGVGPLTRLANAAVGDVVTVAGPDGSPLEYRVTDVARIKQSALPLDDIFRPDGDHQLVVVTCGGRYLPDAGGYEDNIVVTAQPVAV